MTPILDFIEDFVVSFVDALNEVTKVDGTSTIKDRFAAVIGGSLGGNLGLRLGRRMPMPQWLNQAIVSWSPASVWQPMVKHATRSHGPKGAMDRYKEREVDESRREYFNLAYDKEELPGVLKAQSTYWYRDGFTNAAALIRLSRIARQEIYNEYFRQWHWRVACEQLIFSHAANVVYGDSSTPVRYTLNVVPTLLAAGEKDNYDFTGIHDGTRFIGERMPQTPGQLLLIRDTGHSIHTERPAFFASKIVEFLRGLKPDATIAALVPVQVLLEYDQLNKLEKDPYLAALVPARVLL
jgi:pimeloyl-ACP methyl ester carboxylesterase